MDGGASPGRTPNASPARVRPASASSAASQMAHAPGDGAASPFADGIAFLSFAARALSRDEFSRCFEPGPASEMPRRASLAALYVAGVGVRYGVLFPLRLAVLAAAACLLAPLLVACRVLLATGTKASRVVTRAVFRFGCGALLLAFSAVVRHHRVRGGDRVMRLELERGCGAEPLSDGDGAHAEAPVETLAGHAPPEKPNPVAPHVFVANHTSWIDYVLLSTWGVPHATVAQSHGGFFGVLQRHALALNGSLFFNRAEAADRVQVAARMAAHIAARPQLAPLLIFPEGTCVNNEYTVLFHKGAFELGAAVCPAAIKYNKRLSDPYWNTREQSFLQHLLYLMTRWMLVADVWWLPPQARRPSEDGIAFAERVKALISEAAGLRNLSWNGYMKNCMRAQDRQRMLRSSQERYAAALRVRAATPVSAAGDEAAAPTALRPYLPAWLSDSAITDLKNELLAAKPAAAEEPLPPGQTALIRDMRAQRSGLVAAWRADAPAADASPHECSSPEMDYDDDAVLFLT